MQKLNFCHQGLLATARLVERRTDLLFENHGISARQWLVLSHLHEAGSDAPISIAKRSGLDKVAVTRACMQLEAMGWIVRNCNPADKRSHLLELTSVGIRRVAAAQQAVREFEMRLVDGFHPRDVANLSRLLREIARQSLCA